VEPSLNAVENSRSDIRANTIVGFMKHNLVAKNSQDFVAMFHVMDHLSDPLDTLRACVDALKPGGTMLVAVHDVNSWSAKLLRSRSPIFDVEHTYLFSKSTGKMILEQAGLEDVKVSSYRNFYSLAYLVHLSPLPKRWTLLILNGFFRPLMTKVVLGVSLGNIWISGRKPHPNKLPYSTD
jgi:SAM-dependent methyltransferase